MSNDCNLTVLELFSGIGGMHYALKASGISGEVRAAIDINTTANRVYRHNHPDTKVLNNNIQRFTPKEILKMNVNTILMSPPCQPFTRVGNKKDVADSRSNALIHICKILDKLPSIEYILMENVKGFEISQARDMYIESLKRANFEYQEFILSPTEIGVPNTRYRYYCIARKSTPFPFKSDSILEHLPNNTCLTKSERQTVSTIIQTAVETSHEYSAYLLPDEVLMKRAWLLDIVHPTSRNTICFTKAYTHYSEGTGSIFCPLAKKELDEVFAVIKEDEPASDEKLKKLKLLQLRYFTPAEVAKLMSFPDKFTFPVEITNKQRYRVLGNSINVALVGKLIEILCKDTLK